MVMFFLHIASLGQMFGYLMQIQMWIVYLGQEGSSQVYLKIF